VKGLGLETILRALEHGQLVAQSFSGGVRKIRPVAVQDQLDLASLFNDVWLHVAKEREDSFALAKLVEQQSPARRLRRFLRGE
jgi:hypothetical protein